MRKRRALTGEAGWSLRRSRILTTHGSADDQHQREIDGAAVLVFGAGGRRPGDVAPDLESVGRVVGDVARAELVHGVGVAALVLHPNLPVDPLLRAKLGYEVDHRPDALLDSSVYERGPAIPYIDR